MKQVDPREWLLCRMQEYGARYLILIYDYIDKYATDETQEEWERLSQEVRSGLTWQDILFKRENKE